MVTWCLKGLIVILAFFWFAMAWDELSDARRGRGAEGSREEALEGNEKRNEQAGRRQRAWRTALKQKADKRGGFVPSLAQKTSPPSLLPSPSLHSPQQN